MTVLIYGFTEKRQEAIQLAEQEIKRFKDLGSKQSEAKMLLALAEASSSQKASDTEKALQMAAEAKSAFRDLSDDLMQGRASLAIINMHAKRAGAPKDRGQDMWKAAMEAQELFSQIGSRKGIALSFHGLAGAHAFRDSYDGAVRSAKEALNLFKTLGLKRLEGLELETLAKFHILEAEPAQAVSFAERALQVAQDSSTGGAACELDALSVLVEAQLAKGSPREAKLTAEQALKRFQAQGSVLGEASVLQMLAQVHVGLDDLTRALVFAREAASMAGDSKKVQAAALRLAAQILISKGDGEQAIETARRAVKVAKLLREPAELALALRALVQACVAQGDMDEAMKTANDECALHRDVGNKQKEALSMLSACGIHSSNGDFEKAVTLAADAQQLVHKVGDAKVEAKAWFTIAEAQLSVEKHSAALWALDRAKKLFQEGGDKRQAVAARLLIAQTNFAQAVQNEEKGGAEADTQKMVESALSEATDALELAKSQGDQTQVAAALTALAKAQTAAMMFQDALKSADEAAEVYRKSGDEWGEGSAHALCAHVHMLNDRHGRAGRAACQAMLLFQRCRDYQAEAWAAGVFDRISAARKTRPPASFPGAGMKKTAGMARVGQGLGLPPDLVFGEEDLEFDAPLMQAGPGVGLRSTLSTALAKRIMQERTRAPTLFSK